MELHAYTRTISDLFSVKRKYVVPRFQREYSWSKEQIKELWDDIINNIQIKYESDIIYQHEEYFIGALVLVGDDKSSTLQIVNGQQRLTTITILLSVLCHQFMDLKKDKVATAIYENYIAGKDDDGEYYFKLENENPKPFFQKNIQHIKREEIKPQSKEEKTLLFSYNELYKLTSRENLTQSYNIDKKIDDLKYEKLLKSIRDQVVKYLKVISITVAEEEAAYTIFETLNARGISLSSVDLIKNTIFKKLKHTHPNDDAQTIWKEMRGVISSRNVGDLETFVRHWWISKYSYASSERVYKEFKKLWEADKIQASQFIQELYDDSKIYLIISFPISEDFKQQEEKSIYCILSALKIFKVKIQRPFLLSLFKAKKRKIIKFSDFKEILQFLEKFHFIFTAICSSRPSGLEKIYHSAAKNLQEASDNTQVIKIINDLQQRLTKKIPEEKVFIEKFKNIRFNNSYSDQKKLIQYIFTNIEKKKRKTNELVPENLSLEHILSQSKGNKGVISQIGNLLPLSQKLNVECDNKPVDKKLDIYKE